MRKIVHIQIKQQTKELPLLVTRMQVKGIDKKERKGKEKRR